MNIREARPGVALTCMALAFVLSACASPGAKERANSLNRSIERYSKMLRWGEYEEAAKLIQYRDREPKPIDYGPLRKLRITAMQVVDSAVKEDLSEAKVLARLSFYHEASGVLHQLDDNQVWWYDEEAKLWLLDDDFPDFDAALRGR